MKTRGIITLAFDLIQRLNERTLERCEQGKFNLRGMIEDLAEVFSEVLNAEILFLDSSFRLVYRKGYGDLNKNLGEALRPIEPLLKRQFLQLASVRPPEKMHSLVHVLAPLTWGKRKPAMIMLVRFPASESVSALEVFEKTLDFVHGLCVLHDARMAEKQYYKEYVSTISQILECKSPSIAEHCHRVSEHCDLLSSMCHLPRDEKEILHSAALVHEIGLVQVSNEILLRPGPVSPSEMALIRDSVEAGYRIITSKIFFELEAIGKLVLHHYERMDGSGYPKGLKGDSIPKASRILAVANAYDAMTVPKPYQSAWSAEEAIEELKRCAGLPYLSSRTRSGGPCEYFDREVVGLFCEHLSSLLVPRA